MKKIKVFLFNGIILTATSLLLKSVGMFFSVYISNKINAESVGIYQLIMTIYMFFITLSCAGINISSSKIISEKIAYREDYYIKDTMKKSIIYCLIAGFISSFALFIFSPFITEKILHSKISCLPLKIIAFSLPFITISNSINGYFSAVQNVKKTAISNIVEQFLKFFIIIFLLNSNSNLSIEDACISIVIGNTISDILSCLLLVLFYKMDIKNRITTSYKCKNAISQLLKITFPIAFTSYIRSFLSTSKQIIIPSRLQVSGISYETAISKYGKINGMAMPLILFPSNFITSFSYLLIPEFSYLNARNSNKRINFTIEKILKFSFIFSFLVFGIFWCFANELSNIFYPNNNIIVFVKALSPIVIFIYVDSIIDSILKGLNKQVSSMVINIIDLFFSILLIYFLLPLFGLKGYIVVLFISEIFNFLLSFFVLFNEVHFKIDLINWLLKPAISIFIINSIFNNFPCTSCFELIFKILLYIICYFIVIFLIKGIVKGDFDL